MERDVEYLDKYLCTLRERPESPPLFQRQSTDIIVDSEAGTTALTQGTTTFHDEHTGQEEGQKSAHPAFAIADAVETAGLKDFLSRPVRIGGYGYSESNVTGDLLVSFRPWNLLFANDAIKNKLHNYGFIRCNIKVKFVVNASPFYYGLVCAQYQPLPELTPSTVVDDGSTRKLISLSQRPHVWLSPQDSDGGTLTLPFFYHKNWLTVKNASEFTNMGKIDLYAYAPLRSANSAVGQGMSITAYAWAEDVVLSAPTLALAMQSQDEYGGGVVSTPATAVARAAGKLTSVPRIGKFARATEIGATAVSQVARLFGYTNVPVIEDPRPLRPSMFPNFASPDIGYPTAKLTLDSKNELSVDPTLLGLKEEDELAVRNIVSRESYYFQTTWATTDAVDKILAYVEVTPCNYQLTNNTNGSILYNTPSSHISALFENWRGDMIYTFRIVKSPFHRGRLRITYDPVGDATNNVVTVAESSSAVFNQIVDLGSDDVVEMRIPYQQAIPWLRTSPLDSTLNIPYSTSATPTFNVDSRFRNGAFTVRVMNVLTAPVATAPISINVSVRGAENLEFANPSSVPDTLKAFQVQSADQIMQSDVGVTVGNTTSTTHLLGGVTFGESVESLRPLLHRVNHVQSSTAAGSSSTGYQMMTYRFHKIPPFSGYDVSGESRAPGLIVTASNFQYNFTRDTPLHWIMRAYVAYRGSMAWHFNASCNQTRAITDWAVTRIPDFQGNNSFDFTNNAAVGTLANVYSARRVMTLAKMKTHSGTVATNQMTQSGLSVECPNYTAYLLQSTSPGNATAPTSTTTSAAYDGAFNDVFALQLNSCSGQSDLSTTVSTWPQVHMYVGAGTDFSLYYYLNAPTYYLQLTEPAAASYP